MVFECSSSGHRIGYVRLFLMALAERRLSVSIVFVLSHDFRGRLEDDVISDARRLNEVQLLFMSEGETDRCQGGGALSRRLNTQRIFDHYLDATSSQLGFVNYFDTVLAGLAVPLLSKRDAAVAGILFRPSVHYPSLGVLASDSVGVVIRLKDWLVRKVDGFIYRRTLKNPRLQVMLTLDPLFTEFARRWYEGGEKVRTLAEPYLSGPEDAGQGTNQVSTRFLIFGMLTERKGLLETLEALLLLTDAELEKSTLIAAGRIHEDIRSELLARTDEIKRHRPAAKIVIRDEYVSEEELAKLIDGCDAVLAPYRRHVGSSGVLALAAHFRRPVVSQRYGLMGALVERYKLGITCEPARPSELASCLRRVINEGPRELADPRGMAEFAASNGRDQFIESIFETFETVSQPNHNSGIQDAM